MKYGFEKRGLFRSLVTKETIFDYQTSDDTAFSLLVELVILRKENPFWILNFCLSVGPQLSLKKFHVRDWYVVLAHSDNWKLLMTIRSIMLWCNFLRRIRPRSRHDGYDQCDGYLTWTGGTVLIMRVLFFVDCGIVLDTICIVLHEFFTRNINWIYQVSNHHCPILVMNMITGRIE